jgi:hypothetical protein
MKDRIVSLPEIALIAATRGIAGAGVGLLLADRLDAPRRRTLGWTLLAVGALSTIPLAADLLCRPTSDKEESINGRMSAAAQRAPSAEL